MDLEKQTLEEQPQQQQPPNESPRQPRTQSVTITALPGPLQGPLQGSGHLDLDGLPQPHEVLPQPDGGQGLNTAPTLLVPPAPSSFPLLQQLQEEATNLREGIAPLPIAPLPTFVGVPLPVTVESPQVCETPSVSTSLTVMNHRHVTHGDSGGRTDDGYERREGSRRHASPLHNSLKGGGPQAVPQESCLTRPLLSLPRGPSQSQLSPWPLSETVEGKALLSLDSPASAPASVAIGSFPREATTAVAKPCLRSCVSAVNFAAYGEGPLGDFGGCHGVHAGNSNAIGDGMGPISFVFLPGGPLGVHRANEDSEGDRINEQPHWASFPLEGHEGTLKNASSESPQHWTEPPANPGRWVVSSSASAMRGPILPTNRSSATAAAIGTPSSATAIGGGTETAGRLWGEAVGWFRLLGLLSVWFFVLFSVASLLQLSAEGAANVLGIVAPVAAVLLFLSPFSAAMRALREGDSRALPVGVFVAQAVACAVAVVYGMKISCNAIFITNATGFLAELCWIAIWASALQQQAECRPVPRPRTADGDSPDGPPSWLRRAVGSLPSSAASTPNKCYYLQRRGPQRAPKNKSSLSTVSSPRLMGLPLSGAGGPPNTSPKGGPMASASRSMRSYQQQHVAVEGASKGPPNGGGASSLSLNHNSSINSCLNRASSSNDSSEGSGSNSGISRTLPNEAGSMRNNRRRCSSSNRTRRRRGQQLEPRPSASLTVVLCCLRWFGLLLFLSSPLLLFLLLLPVALIGWLQVPAALCLFAAHVPRLCFMIQAKSHECLPLPLVLMGVLCNGCWALLGYVSNLAAVCCVGVVGYLFSALQMHVIWWSKGSLACIDFDFLGEGSCLRCCRGSNQSMLPSRSSPRR